MKDRLTPELLDGVAAQIKIPAGFHLRRALPADLPKILALAQTCFTYDVPERANLRHFLTRGHAAFFAIGQNDEVIAYGFAEANRRTGRCYVNTVCTAPAWRGRGLGGAVYKALIEAGRAAGYPALTAHVEVDNAGAVALMRALGFTAVAHIDDYYYDNGNAAFLMRLDL